MVFGHRTGSHRFIGDIGPVQRSRNILTRLIDALHHKKKPDIDEDISFIREAASSGEKWRAHFEREYQKWIEKGETGIAATDLATVADIDRVTDRLNAIATRLADYEGIVKDFVDGMKLRNHPADLANIMAKYPEIRKKVYGYG